MNRKPIERALVVAALLAWGSLTPHAQQPDGQQALQKRIEALEAGQQAILKELRDIKALLAKPVAPPPVPAVVTGLVSIANSPSLGPANAALTIVEFSDFECPFCGRYTRQTFKQIQTEFIDSGKVRYVFRNLPLEGSHPQAFGAAIAGECARAQGKFWEMHDRMFADQRALAKPGLLKSAEALGLDLPAFERCLSADAPKSKVRQDMADAVGLGANATPTFFLGVEEKDGKLRVLQRITGAKTFPVFKTALDTVLSSPAFKQ